MRRTRTLLAAGLLVLAVSSTSGCELFGDTDGGIRLETDRTSYTVDPSTTIQVTVTNGYDDSVYYVCTGQIYLEEIEGGRIVDAWLVHGFEECFRRVPIESGASESFTMSFDNSLAPDRLETARFDESVHYHLRVDLFETDEVERKLDKRDRLSNRFEIVR